MKDWISNWCNKCKKHVEYICDPVMDTVELVCPECKETKGKLAFELIYELQQEFFSDR